MHCKRQREVGVLATIRSPELSVSIFSQKNCIISLFMHSHLFISPQYSVRSGGEEPRKIFKGKFHRIVYRREIQFNTNKGRNSKTPCIAKCLIYVNRWKNLILNKKEECYCKKEFSTAVNKQIRDKNDDRKSKGY